MSSRRIGSGKVAIGRRPFSSADLPAVTSAVSGSLGADGRVVQLDGAYQGAAFDLSGRNIVTQVGPQAVFPGDP